MLRYIQGGARGQEEDTDDEQLSTSSSGTLQPQLASMSVDSKTNTQQRTATSESTSPVIESPSAGDKVETCVTCSLSCSLSCC